MTEGCVHLPGPASRRHLRRGLIVVGLAVIVGHASLLRLDALTQKYGPVESPSWLRVVQESRLRLSAFRPAGMTWPAVPLYPHADGPPTRYQSDPYTYLKYAREMDAFYAAHRREPLFPFITKGFLWVFDQQDIAVSMASALCSLLAVAGTFALGARAFSPVVGLGAALALGIERDVIGLSVEGWRDDAFTAATIWFAYSAVRYLDTPTRHAALLLGVFGGIASLIRITSISFVFPAIALLLLFARAAWKARLVDLALAAAVCTVVIAPFLVNCWVVFGDPLYAINVHADVYRAAEGQTIERTQTAREYIGVQLREHPIRTLDTFALGMTSYPFTNKWRGFAAWGGAVGVWLSWAAVAGLFLWCLSHRGQLLLVLLAGSLLPYAFTWRTLFDWRFTAHAYPFFLVAACFALWTVASLIRQADRESLGQMIRSRQILVPTIVAATIAGSAVALDRVVPCLVTAESLGRGEDVTISAGPRDACYFRAGWTPPVRNGNVTSRSARGPFPSMHVPLAAGRAYSVTVRIDPDPAPTGGAFVPSATTVFLNNQPLARFALGWNPQRFGAYDVTIPAGWVSAGGNTLTFAGEGGFRVWYLRVRPLQAER